MPIPLFVFFFGAICLGAGMWFAYRFKVINERPDIAFGVLCGYGLAILGMCALLGQWLDS